MGLLSKAYASVRPQAGRAIAQSIPTWQNGAPQPSSPNYTRYAKEGYSTNELVYATIDTLCTSVAEPRLAAYRRSDPDAEPEQVQDHPILDLFERPNPFMNRFLFMSTWMMYRAIAGNNFVEVVDNRLGQPVELWAWRPDLVRIVPDATTFIREYQLDLGDTFDTIDPAHMMHSKTRNPLDRYYGMPPMQAAAGRIDTDNYMREFTKQFFTNAGVPAGILNVEAPMNPTEKEMIRAQYRSQYAGPGNWHSLMLLAGGKATYTPMGLPMGPDGLALSEVENINASRITMVWGVPLSVVGAKLGMESSSYANRVSDERLLWTNTLVPIYRDFAADINSFLVPRYAKTNPIDFVEFDLSDVRALEENRNELHDRVRADFVAGLIPRKQAYTVLGYADPTDDDAYLIPMSVVAEPVKLKPEVDPVVTGVPRLASGKSPSLEEPPDNQVGPASNGHRPQEAVPRS